MLAKAIEFASRSKSYVVSAALHKWRNHRVTVQNALAFAAQYHAAQLQYKMLYIWRLQLRSKLKLARKARTAEKYFIKRQAWTMWRHQMDGRKREKKR